MMPESSTMESAEGAPVPSDASPADQSTLAPGIRLMPDEVRGEVYLLYHVLWTLDDLVDEDRPEAAERITAVERWARGEPAQTPETRALSKIAERRTVAPDALLTFCHGMRHDMARATIDTEDELETYCQQVGGAVGIILARMLGSADAESERRMATLGRAVQRTNILRDIDADAAQNRVYIPSMLIERFGPPTAGRREDLLRDQIAKADALYDRALTRSPLVATGQRGVMLAAALYREVLRQIEREGFGRRPGRVVVPTWRRRMISTRHRVAPR